MTDSVHELLFALLTLLDRIEFSGSIQEAHKLAAQRLAIAESHGMTVTLIGVGSGETNDEIG